MNEIKKMVGILKLIIIFTVPLLLESAEAGPADARGQIQGRVIAYVEHEHGDDGGFVVYNDAFEEFAAFPIAVPNNNADLIQAITRLFNSYGYDKFSPQAKAEIAEILHYSHHNLANAVANFNRFLPVRNVVGRSNFYEIVIGPDVVWIFPLEDYEMPGAEGVENE